MVEGPHRLKELWTAIKMNGGITDVAVRADVAHPNLSSWLNGKPTLSAERIDRVLETIGLINGEPRSDRVHEWRVSHAFSDLSLGLRVYFPAGAELKVAPWSVPGKQWQKIVRRNRVDEVFAMSDGRTRAILRAPSGAFAAVGQAVGGLLRPSNGSVTESLLDIGENDISWLEPGVISVEEFDQKFQVSLFKTLQDLGDLILAKKIDINDVYDMVSKL